MAVVFRPACASAVYLKGYAMKIGLALQASGGNCIYRTMDGYVLRALRVGPNIVVTALDIPTLICSSRTYRWDTGHVFTNKVIQFAPFTLPTSRDTFLMKPDALEMKELNSVPQQIYMVVAFGPILPGSITDEYQSHGYYMLSDDGVAVSVLTKRGDNILASVFRASALQNWFDDQTTEEEISNGGYLAKKLSMNRVGRIEFSEAALAGYLGGRILGGNHRNHSQDVILNSVCERTVDDCVGILHTFTPATENMNGGVMMIHHTMEFPDGADDNTPPNLIVNWISTVTNADLPSFFVPHYTTGVAAPNRIGLTAACYTDTVGVIVAEAMSQDLGAPDLLEYEGAVAITFDPTTGARTIDLIQLDRSDINNTSFHYVYTPLLGIAIEAGPRVVSFRARKDNDNSLPFGQLASYLSISIVAPGGVEILADLGGFWPNGYAFGGVAPPSGGRFPVGSFIPTVDFHNPITGNIVGLTMPVCEYAADVMAVVCAPNGSFGGSAIERHIALVQISTGALLDVRPTGIVGDMYHNFSITCPRRAVGHFESGNWVEDRPGSLIMTISRESGPYNTAPSYGTELRGIWISNVGGTEFVYCYQALSIVDYYLGSPFYQKPTRSAESSTPFTLSPP